MQIALEVLVEETIADGVYADGGHRRQVAEGEQRVVMTGHEYFVVPVDDGVEDIEREPADGEGHHDGEEHGVDPPAFGQPALALPHFLHDITSPFKTDIYLKDMPGGKL